MRGGVVSAAVIALAMTGCGGNEPQFEGTGEQHEAHHEAPAHHAEGAPHHAEAAPSGPRPTRVMDDGARLFGAELGEAPLVALSEITASPDRYAGQVVRTEGTIERVCQAMGCWMELRGENAPAVRVPMAGHAFFLPRDVAGRAATIEGRVAVQALSPDMRAHLESEGALATASSLSIDATGVVVR
ncbi:DUF4920 domain-containing protein [Sandaracinus amylolyticus]|uniref:DUF4920 domain-containing protein n=1 Tax=Sandaracinus amylolyticus TaxID=927083 RepID=A0A0F6W2R8_9BACT|nr:DUF4920 domain-containing protein [Sandaracinus amylolyticus]AKF05796.1 hypothetical protein DB32_002945 [Sandaracinus amylolyticus]